MHSEVFGVGGHMEKISAIIITYNEEEVIGASIDSISWADEVVVVDSGSTDRTRDVALAHGARVVSHPFADFASQRNFALKQARCEFVFYLDADEEVDGELRLSIEKELLSPGSEAYSVRRKNFYLGHPWPKEETVVRLFQKKGFRGWTGQVHESPKLAGSTLALDGYIWHRTHRTIEAMLKKTIVWSAVEAELRYKAHHPPVTWWRVMRVMVTGFFDYYILQQGYRVGTVGLIESLYQAYSLFVTYARLWELQTGKKK